MANKKHFLAGPGKALLFRGDDLIGVATALTNNTFGFTIDSEEIRGGYGNVLFGKYYHDSNLNVTLTDAMFNLEYIAAALGTNVEQGGLSIEETQVILTTAGKVTVAEQPLAFDSGVVIGWYKKPSEETWNIGNFDGKTLTIPGGVVGDTYCVKYFYQNENARSIVINAQYVPSVLHVVLINDLFAAETADLGSGEKYGRLITDIPRLQLDGSQDLSLDASGGATVELTGSALATSGSAGNECEEKQYYATMTEEIFNKVWQDSVIALAVENSEIEVTAGAEPITLNVRAVFGGSVASKRYPNTNFTFVGNNLPEGVTVNESGVVTVAADATAGQGHIEVTLTGYADVPPAFVEVTVVADNG